MTKLLIYLILIKVVSWGSKPTVWDGDIDYLKIDGDYVKGSKPTVWDGDHFPLKFVTSIPNFPVLSPLCGMETI